MTAPASIDDLLAAPPDAPPVASPARQTGFADLPGWDGEDHAAALRAFAAGCRAAKEPVLASVCRAARAAGPLDEAGARKFLEARFKPAPDERPGLLTAYFTPIYEARNLPEGEFDTPVRPRPTDLPRQALTSAGGFAYADRAEIEARPAEDAVAWMRAEDLFFLQIQGSGVLVFPDGVAQRAVFDGSNGAPFSGIAQALRRAGLLTDSDSSADRIRTLLAANRGQIAREVMQTDRRYVFFRLEPDDGAEPAGAAGVRLPPGRSLAVDPSRHAMGEVFWIDAAAPTLPGAFPAYRRLALALDTGGAIKGEIRADLYLGRGPEAGQEAGRVRHVLHMHRLTPVDAPAS